MSDSAPEPVGDASTATTAPAATGPASSTRGQTTIDFAIGASVFLIVVAFVLTFVPGMFAPFEDPDRGQEADRTATTLATAWLTSPATPYRLDVTCTRAFFEQMQDGTDAPSECRYDTTTDDLEATVGVRGPISLNVTVERLDGGVVTDGVDLRAGDPVPTTGNLAVARRVVGYGDRTYRLIVRAW